MKSFYDCGVSFHFDFADRETCDLVFLITDRQEITFFRRIRKERSYADRSGFCIYGNDIAPEKSVLTDIFAGKIIRALLSLHILRGKRTAAVKCDQKIILYFFQNIFGIFIIADRIDHLPVCRNYCGHVLFVAHTAFDLKRIHSDTHQFTKIRKRRLILR